MHDHTQNVDEFESTALSIMQRLLKPIVKLRQSWRRQHDRRGFKDRWTEWGGQLSYSAFLIWLAGDVANQLINDNPSVAEQMRLVDSAGSQTQDAAERFLQHQFKVYPIFGAAAYQRTIRIFRHMIKRKLAHSVHRGRIESEHRSLV